MLMLSEKSPVSGKGEKHAEYWNEWRGEHQQAVADLE